MSETGVAEKASVNYAQVCNGSMGIGHRPKLKKLNEYRECGVTHIWTLLSEKEGASDIKKAALKHGMDWLWLPLSNGKPPDPEMNPEITACFENCKQLLDNGARVYLHCSAGIHRTGMIAYAFFRFLGYSGSESIAKLSEMRALTSKGAGTHRLEWGDYTFGQGV